MSPLQKLIKTMGTILAVVLAVSIIGSILVTIFFMVDTASHSKKESESTTKVSSTTEKTSYTDTFQNIDALDLDCGTNDISILADSTDGNVTVELINISPKDELENRNGCLYYDQHEQHSFNLDGLRWLADFLDGSYSDTESTTRYSGEVVFHVPENQNFWKLDIDAGIGRIEMQDIAASQVDIDAGTGSMDFLNVSFADLDLDAGTGSITYNGKLLGKTNIQAGTGSIDLVIQGNKDDYKIDIDNGLGGLTVDGVSCSGMKTSPSSAPNSIKVDSGTGSITLNFEDSGELASLSALSEASGSTDKETGNSSDLPGSSSSESKAPDQDNDQSVYFDSLESGYDRDVIYSDFVTELTGNEANFLYIEVTEDCKAVIHYTYSTGDKKGAKLGFSLEEKSEKTAYQLAGSSDDAYNSIWSDKSITLKKGMNRFYVTGENINCKMHFEINGISKDNVSYMGSFPKN